MKVIELLFEAVQCGLRPVSQSDSQRPLSDIVAARQLSGLFGSQQAMMTFCCATAPSTSLPELA